MKKYLLPESGTFYKANLHCHTTFSDGAYTPEQVKNAYLAQGYSIVAYTDHDILIPHPELADEGFLPLNGFEIEVNEPKDCGKLIRKCCHLCFVALDRDNITMPFFHREKYLFSNAKNYRDAVKFDESKPDYERTYDPDCINDMIRMGCESGFFVTYNHPTWSLEDYGDYSNYKNAHAMEICNYSALSAGYSEYNERVYDDMLRGGERLYCIGADDNHNKHPESSGLWDSFGAFTVIKAEDLKYETITKALLDGHFYASQGPRIHSLWVEDDQVHITCSGAARVAMTCGKRKAKVVYSHMGEPVEKASFPLAPDYVYFRITVTDFNGNHANTNAYFMDEILEEQ